LDNKQTVCNQNDEDDEQPQDHHHHYSQGHKLREHGYIHLLCKPKFKNNKIQFSETQIIKHFECNNKTISTKTSPLLLMWLRSIQPIPKDENYIFSLK
jgi:hypothetical protein